MGRSTDAGAAAARCPPIRSGAGGIDAWRSTDAHSAASADAAIPPRLFTPAFIALSLAELAYFTAAGLTIPITPLFARGPLGATEAGVGLAVGAFSVTTLVLRPYAGRVSDRLGRRPLLVGGALAFAAVLAAHAVVDAPADAHRPAAAARRRRGVLLRRGFAAVADLAPPGRTGEALSFNSLSLYLGLAIGPILGQPLLDAGGFPLAWLGGAVAALAARVLAWRIPETGRAASGDAGPTPFFNRAALGPSLALFSGIVGMAGFLAFVAIYATENLGFDGAERRAVPVRPHRRRDPGRLRAAARSRRRRSGWAPWRWPSSRSACSSRASSRPCPDSSSGPPSSRSAWRS